MFIKDNKITNSQEFVFTKNPLYSIYVYSAEKLIGYLDYSFEILIFEYFETNQNFCFKASELCLFLL